MAIQLNPNEWFPITCHIDDPSDANTYYVQASIRDSDGNLIENVDLTDEGSGAGDQRFRKLWQVPQDPSGEGKYITITVKVYTDSGYTTLAPLKGIRQDDYLIFDRRNPYFGLGAGRVKDKTNYKQIGKIVKNELAFLAKGLSFPKLEKVNIKPLAKEIKALRKELTGKVEGLEIPEAVDFLPVVERIQEVKDSISNLPAPEKVNLSPILKAINDIHIPEPEKVNLSPIVQSLENVLKKMTENMQGHDETITEKIAENTAKIKEFFQHSKEVEDVFRALDEIKTKTEKVKRLPIKPIKPKEEFKRKFI